MPSAEQQSLIDALRRFLESDQRVEAVWLAGSLGRGAGDDYSDVDLLVLVADGAVATTSTALARGLGEVVKPVLLNELYGGRILNVVTEDWQRFDLSIVEGADLPRYDSAELTTLFNRADRAPPVQPDLQYQTAPEALLKLAQEFLRVLGLLVGAMGREEYELGLRGVDLLRGMTLELMLEENGIAPSKRGGALHRRPFLTADQLADLATIPPQAATRAGVIAPNLAIAAIFLPRARRLAAKIGAAWPTEFEAATGRHLKLKLQLDI